MSIGNIDRIIFLFILLWGLESKIKCTCLTWSNIKQPTLDWKDKREVAFHLCWSYMSGLSEIGDVTL